MSACESKRNAELLVTVLEKLRNEDSFDSMPRVCCRLKEKRQIIQYFNFSKVIKAIYKHTIPLQQKIDTVKFTMTL